MQEMNTRDHRSIAIWWSGCHSRLASSLDRHLPTVLVAPAILLLLLLVAYPLVYTVWLSLQRWTVTNETIFVGLNNFVRMLGNERVFNSIRATAVFVGGGVVIQMILGVSLATLLNREFLGHGIVRTVMMIPLLATPVAVAMVWNVMLDANLGIINHVLSTLGLPHPHWLSKEWALISVMLVDTWQHTPFIMLVALGALAGLPTEPFEAARIDGASRWQGFWYLTLPMITPALMVALLFRLISSLQTFDLIFVITLGGPELSTEVVSVLAYFMAFEYGRFGDAAAILVVLGLVILALSLVILRLRRFE